MGYGNTVLRLLIYLIKGGEDMKEVWNGCSNSSSKFTEEDIIFIRKNYKKRDPMYGGVALARRYSCCPQTIYDIVTKKHYKE